MITPPGLTSAEHALKRSWLVRKPRRYVVPR